MGTNRPKHKKKHKSIKKSSRNLWLAASLALTVTGGVVYSTCNSFDSIDFEEKLDPQQIKERVLNAIESTYGISASEFPQAFYDSRTIELYLPDIHNDDFVDHNKRIIKRLNQELKKQGVPLQAIGLEGITHGFKDPSAIKRLRHFQESSQYAASVLFTQALRVLSTYTENVDSTYARNQVHNALEIYYTDLISGQYEQTTGRSDAPGTLYWDVFPRLYGLENVDTDSLSNKVGEYISCTTNKHLLDSVIFLTKREPEGIGKQELVQLLEGIHQNTIARQERIRLAIPPGKRGELDEALKIFDPSLDEPKTDLFETWKDTVLWERTAQWIGSAPDSITGVVGIIGGAGHMRVYIDLAMQKRQSYVVLFPKEDLTEFR